MKYRIVFQNGNNFIFPSAVFFVLLHFYFITIHYKNTVNRTNM